MGLDGTVPIYQIWEDQIVSFFNMFEIHWQTTRVQNLRPLAYIRAQETDGGAKNVKSVLGVPYKIEVLATLQ
jgi:hypothetical protein